MILYSFANGVFKDFLSVTIVHLAFDRRVYKGKTTGLFVPSSKSNLSILQTSPPTPTPRPHFQPIHWKKSYHKENKIIKNIKIRNSRSKLTVGLTYSLLVATFRLGV